MKINILREGECCVCGAKHAPFKYLYQIKGDNKIYCLKCMEKAKKEYKEKHDK